MSSERPSTIHISTVVAAADADAIQCAVAALRRGELVGMPTETVYGLAADAGDAAAVGRVFLAKGRPRFNPLIVHVADADVAASVGDLPPGALKLAAEFWPGPLTMVVPKRAGAPVADLALAGLTSVAIRMPAHPVARALIREFGGPLVAPSANRSGHVSATTAAHVAGDLGDRVAVILDAGASAIGLESTIVGFAGERPVLLRAGAIPRAAIEEVLGAPLAKRGEGGEAPQAPGMLASHYAPAAQVRLRATDVAAGEALLAFGPVLPANADNAVAVINLSPAGDLSEAAARFFSALRELDAAAPAIAVAPIPEEGLGEAINDRLRRAAAPRDGSPGG
jgi:L-threonylcarbamoyladenylate synthase